MAVCSIVYKFKEPNQFKANLVPRVFPLENRKSPEDKAENSHVYDKDLQQSCVSPGKKNKQTNKTKQKTNTDRTSPGAPRAGDGAPRAPQSLLAEYTVWGYVYANHSLPKGGTENYLMTWGPIFKIWAEQLSSVTKTALKSPSSCVNRIPMCLVFVPAQEPYGTSVDHHSLNWLRR